MIRPATPQDAETAARLVIEGDIAELGEADYSLGGLRDEWSEAGFELAKDAVIAETDGVPTGYAHFRGSDVLITGEPAEALLEWALQRATERGHERLRSAVGHLADERRALDPRLSRVADRGFALVRRWEDGVAYLALLAVHPQAAGRGLGSTLLRGVFAAAAQAGLRQVWLNVASDNPHAVRLYERVGMRQGWRIDDYQTALPD